LPVVRIRPPLSFSSSNGAVADPEHRLHQRLAKRRLTHHKRAVVILHRARHNLRGTGAAAIDEHHQRRGRVALLERQIVLIRILHAAPGIHDHLPALQEPVGHGDRLVERSAGIVAQVQHQSLQPFSTQLGQRSAQLAIGGLRKILQADVPRARRNHERRAHRGDVDLVAVDGQGNQLIEAADGNIHRGALRTSQFLHRLLAGPALGALALDNGDDVAAPDACAVGRCPLKQVGHGDVVVHHDDAQAEAVVDALLPLAHPGVRLGLQKT